MGFVVNLRGDLARLCVAELADRLRVALTAYEAAVRKSRIKLQYSRRGPVRHPWAYRAFSIIGVGVGDTYRLGIGPLPGFVAYHQHLSLCEIKDLTDEIERRTTPKQAPAT